MTQPPHSPSWRRFLSTWHWSSDNAAALLLAFSALATAWSSYQASVWGGVQFAQYTLSSVLRGKATMANDEAARRRLIDVLLFTKWLEASLEQRPKLESLYVTHFRPEFRVAFEAWQVDSNRRMNSTPFERADYLSAKTREADSIQRAAGRALEVGQHANAVSDRYVFQTVIFATVLFFAGAVRPLVGPGLRSFLLLFATLLCVAAVTRLVTTPVTR